MYDGRVQLDTSVRLCLFTYIYACVLRPREHLVARRYRRVTHSGRGVLGGTRQRSLRARPLSTRDNRNEYTEQKGKKQNKTQNKTREGIAPRSLYTYTATTAADHFFFRPFLFRPSLSLSPLNNNGDGETFFNSLSPPPSPLPVQKTSGHRYRRPGARRPANLFINSVDQLRRDSRVPPAKETRAQQRIPRG